MEVEALHPSSGKTLGLFKVDPDDSILTLKKLINREKKIPVVQQELRPEAKGKGYPDELKLKDLRENKVYVKNLGPQIGYRTVFLAEYAGPLFIYLIFYTRPSFLYHADVTIPMTFTAHLACACWTFHYAKRLLESVFVHRFSHATMPMANLWRNCGYYWAFAAYVAWHVNHPLFTSPCQKVVYVALATFLLCEIGNLSIHIALRDLRPPGSKVRRIPYPTWNPFTTLFGYVSCPNYTYEFGAWLSFTFMTSCLPAGMFCLVGMYQMTVWALGKHKAYKKDFGSDYPRERKAILPFIL